MLENVTYRLSFHYKYIACICLVESMFTSHYSVMKYKTLAYLQLFVHISRVVNNHTRRRKCIPGRRIILQRDRWYWVTRVSPEVWWTTCLARHRCLTSRGTQNRRLLTAEVRLRPSLTTPPLPCPLIPSLSFHFSATAGKWYHLHVNRFFFLYRNYLSYFIYTLNTGVQVFILSYIHYIY